MICIFLFISNIYTSLFCKELMYMKSIYEVKLYSLSSDIVVYNDWSKKQNIHNNIKMEHIQFIRRIMVQETMFKRYMKEIITGRYIPINKKQIFWQYEQPFPRIPEEELKKVDYSILANSLVFIGLEEYFDIYGKSSNNIREVRGSQLEEYLKQNTSSTSTFRTDLENVFKESQGFYRIAEERNCFYNDEIMVRTLIKNAKNQGLIKR